MAAHLDSQGRTIRVEQPNLKLNKTTKRSATNQKRAGVKDRLPTDEGGHYGGRRFEGPTHEFNHFAQNMNLNRGAYKRLENEWERLIEAGNDSCGDHATVPWGLVTTTETRGGLLGRQPEIRPDIQQRRWWMTLLP
ncbi:DNA/RNA non-specific endonuclease [Enemella evansiae]|uniref:DNA/RNA non-specific endonuclease n=1 Tax=Enemella evansiae TaxID=2016499 RepID=UPI003983BFC5